MDGRTNESPSLTLRRLAVSVKFFLEMALEGESACGYLSSKNVRSIVKDVFEEFLLEQESKLAPKTYRGYASVIELFEHQ